MALFAMAGLAEAAMMEAIALLFLGNVAIGIMAIVVVICRSRLTTVICCLLWLLEMSCLSPWAGFITTSSDDPDWIGFQQTFRSLAGWWVAVSIVFAFAVIAVMFDRLLIWPRKMERRLPPKHSRKGSSGS